MTVYAVLDGVGRLWAIYAQPEDAWDFALKTETDAELRVEPWEVRGGAQAPSTP